MAICEWCHGEATSCTANMPFDVDGVVYQPIAAEYDCGECGVAQGGLHHLGCEMETCPCCGGQRMDCNCDNPACPKCKMRMHYEGADDQREFFECPSCGTEIER